MDGVQQTEIERREDSANLDRNWATASQSDRHWLPVSQRVVFETALVVCKCVHGVAPAYLGDLCVPATAISSRQHLRSAATSTL